MAESESCMFCLDDIKPQEAFFNPIGCHCAYKAHQSCLAKWFEQKNQYECPICHAVSIPNPVQTPLQVIVLRERSNEIDEAELSHHKCVGWCCLSFIAWAVIINVIDLVLRS